MATKLVKKPKMDLAEKAYLPEFARGMKTSLKHFFKNTVLTRKSSDIATIDYPEERRVYPERFRGIHRLTHRDDGSSRCVACMCCSTVCPAQCIHIEAGAYDQADPRAGYEKFPKVFVIDELRCISCGYCVEACPCDAIRMDSGEHMPPSTKRDHFIYEKDILMSMPSKDGTFETANPRHEPGDADYPGVDREGGH